MIASGYPHLEEAYKVAELLFPGARHRPSAQRSARHGARRVRRRRLQAGAPRRMISPRLIRSDRASSGLKTSACSASSIARGSARAVHADRRLPDERRASLLVRCARLRGRWTRALAGWIALAALVASGRPPRRSAACPTACCRRPAPSLAAGWRLTLSGELPRNIEVSFLRAMAGLVVGGGIGFALGLANGLSRSANGSPTRRCR